jgi:hypothetical protein
MNRARPPAEAGLRRTFGLSEGPLFGVVSRAA